MGKRNSAYCPACDIKYDFRNNSHRKQQHHVLPIRFFGETGLIQWLCEECHKEIEKEIPAKTIKSILWYFQKVIEFVDRKRKERGL